MTQLPGTLSILEIVDMKKVQRKIYESLFNFLFSEPKMNCRVCGCSEKHRSHYCRLCGLKNSTHFSQDCPQGRILYHGTRLLSIKGISSEGLRPSPGGRLGPGIYFAESYKVAETISLYRCGRDKGNGAAVFECNVNLGKIKDLMGGASCQWQTEDFDSAKAIHPQWAGAGEFIEFCLKDDRKCSVRKVVVTQGHIDGLGNFEIKKLDREWKELRQLDNEPTFKDVRDISHLRLKNLLPSHRKAPHYLPLTTPLTTTPSTRFLSCIKDNGIVVPYILKVIFFLINITIQVTNAVVQKNLCGHYSSAIDSLIVFISLRTAVQIIYFLFLGRDAITKRWYRLFCCTLAIKFLTEMPMMVSDAYVVKSCGRVEAWTLTLHISYIAHLWLTWILDCIIAKWVCDGFGWCKFFIFITLSFVIPPVMYVPVYLKLADKAYDFQLDISKIHGDSTGIARFIRILLIHFGTIGWGIWCATFAAIPIGLFYIFYILFF